MQPDRRGLNFKFRPFRGVFYVRSFRAFKSRHGTLLSSVHCSAGLSRPYLSLKACPFPGCFLFVSLLFPDSFLFHVFPHALPLCEITNKLEVTSPFESCRTLKSRHGALRHHRIALCVLYRLCFPLRPSAHGRVVAYLFVSLPLSLYKYLTFNFPALL